MMKNDVFKEKQRFEDKGVFVLLSLGLLGSLVGLVQSLLGEQVAILHAAAYLALALLLGGYGWWLLHLQLKVAVNDKRIKFKLSPLQAKAQKIRWEEVDSYAIVKTPRVALWHGGNIQFSGESCYSLTGRNGLSLVTKDGHRYFIGCQDVEELADTLEDFPLP